MNVASESVLDAIQEKNEREGKVGWCLEVFYLRFSDILLNEKFLQC